MLSTDPVGLITYRARTFEKNWGCEIFLKNSTVKKSLNFHKGLFTNDVKTWKLQYIPNIPKKKIQGKDTKYHKIFNQI